MNVYYLAPHLIDSSIERLRSMESYKELSIGDLVLIRLGRRLVFASIAGDVCPSKKILDFPMAAQIVCDDENLPKLLPILYYNNGYCDKIVDLRGLKLLEELFKEHSLIRKLLSETISICRGCIELRDASLSLELLKISQKIPQVPCDSNLKLIQEGHAKPLKTQGKLLIVEKYFSDKMKQEFYDNIELGKSERESLVLVRRKHTMVFQQIIDKVGPLNIYSRLSVL